MSSKDLPHLSGKRVAIVGGAGFIGHNLALYLQSIGAESHVIDGLQVNNLGYYSSGYAENENAELYLAFIEERLSLLRANKVGLHVLDARDYHSITKMLSTLEPDVVIHLAAVAHANRSNKDPYSTFDHSLRTLENVLDASRSSGAHIVFLSSSMVYGDFNNKVAVEDQPCNPIGIYGALKYAAEKILIGYGQVFEVPFTIIRPSALYGERCVSRRVGQAFIENALLGRPLSVNGDGTDLLDFTYIDDLVRGVSLSLLKPAAFGEVFNITFGQSRRIKDLAHIVTSRFPGLEIIENPRSSLMPERGTLSIDKAKNLLGYNPSYAIENGFGKYLDWYQDFADSRPDLFSR